MLQSRRRILHFCSQHPEARIPGGWSKDVYGFYLQTAEHRYYLRWFLLVGDYNLIVLLRSSRALDGTAIGSSLPGPSLPTKTPEPGR